MVLGPLKNLPRISYQLKKRCIRFLHNLKTKNEIVLTCYCNACRNANTPIWHNITFLGNTLEIDIDNEITQHINLPTVYFTKSSNLKLFIAVGNGAWAPQNFL